MNLTVEIASVPDRESWVAEIWDGDIMIAEIARDSGGIPSIEFYHRDGTPSLIVNLETLCQAIGEAVKKLGIDVRDDPPAPRSTIR